MDNAKFREFLHTCLNFIREQWNSLINYHLNSIDLSNVTVDRIIVEWHSGYVNNALSIISLVVLFLTLLKCCNKCVAPHRALYFILISSTLLIYLVADYFRPSSPRYKSNEENSTSADEIIPSQATFSSIVNPNPLFWSRTFTPLLHSICTYCASLLYFVFDGAQSQDGNKWKMIGKYSLFFFTFLCFCAFVTTLLIITFSPYNWIMLIGQIISFGIFVSVMMQVYEEKKMQVNQQEDRLKAKTTVLPLKGTLLLLVIQCIIAFAYAIPRSFAYKFNIWAEIPILLAPPCQSIALLIHSIYFAVCEISSSHSYLPIRQAVQPSPSDAKPQRFSGAKRLETIDSESGSMDPPEAESPTAIRRNSFHSFEQVPKFDLDFELNVNVSGLNTPIRQDSIDNFEHVPEFSSGGRFKFEDEPGASIKNVSNESFEKYEPFRATSDFDMTVHGVETPIRRASNERFDTMIGEFAASEFHFGRSEPQTPIRRASMEYFDRIPSLLAASALLLANTQPRSKNTHLTSKKTRSLMNID